MSDASADQPPVRVEPIGAPTDLTHPANLVAAPAPVAAMLSDAQLKGIGRFLAFGWYMAVALRFMLLTGSSSQTWDRLTWLVPGLYLVAVHVYAIKTGQRRILAGFWPWVLVGLVVLAVAPIVWFFVALAGLD